jgi:D-sedoheptulose 7-phosphate isomerase
MSSVHLDNLIQRCPDLKSIRDEIEAAYFKLKHCQEQGGKFVICGNGGSAADAEHWAGELLKGFKSKRSLSIQEKSSLPPYLSEKLQGFIRAIPLTGFSSLATAFGNDVDPQLIYAQLTWGLGEEGDVFIGISTSGNARNICYAAEVARARGLFVLGLSGETGGNLKALCDLCLCCPSTETYRIQEFHLPIYHCLSLMLEDEFFN